ncbi:hypothetical protein CPAST_c07200 [Clostridium pasteurianum DSM 525 = ATCC 6013]|uniref:DsrE family protein n=1 Tax=Clostridium pasteurianum DSM 525 = ATCC 6013 TaxID=1262449 RepID=A0A0H3J762_CLOPA|nr:DsrE family protein [Clostridium pasteurianum]AJA46820.1 hypothetical protein CPAST_c07200 [Clostridium pasteurianum DSM 525 = ATCC 6013]AJA50808.1 hypothetical protein CLPA_c07200 [Clostridium pasteurianum DSM 525 = ATCC 6013]AOZ74213.1 hypothetical protein AQ983_03470 [Clostridium pasteurianum DSM 525 = ATCC 6013]AOZ78011.1 hypothetical protein AQ984_03470 [Clostridium pasteurianum]ELP58569.1 hypothetical protein F502_13855 [Clostridium pasteurianum DSM 525 = ATCC 6013]
MQQKKILFHIDELNKWDLLLKDVSISINFYRDIDFHIYVLATSEAVKFYNSKDISYTHLDFMEYLANNNVEFAAGKEDMDYYDIDLKNLVQFVQVVPSGSLELVNRQKEGYTYLKAW